MSQLIQQQDLLHQLHIGRDEAALTAVGLRLDLLLLQTAGDIHRLPRHHLDSHLTLRLRSDVVINAVTKIDSFRNAVSDLLPQYNLPDVGAVESVSRLLSQTALHCLAVNSIMIC